MTDHQNAVEIAIRHLETSNGEDDKNLVFRAQSLDGGRPPDCLDALRWQWPSLLFGDDKPSIAVLPFQNLSTDPEQEYFCDGVVEDITMALSRFRWLFVIARNSSFTYMAGLWT